MNMETEKVRQMMTDIVRKLKKSGDFDSEMDFDAGIGYGYFALGQILKEYEDKEMEGMANGKK